MPLLPSRDTVTPPPQRHPQARVPRASSVLGGAGCLRSACPQQAVVHTAATTSRGFCQCTVSCVHHDRVLHRRHCPKPPVLPLLGVPATLTLPCRRSSPCSGTPWIWVHTACGLSGSASLTYSLLCSFWRRCVPGVWPLPLVTVTAGSEASAVSLALTLPPPPYEDAGPLGTQVVPTCRCLT